MIIAEDTELTAQRRAGKSEAAFRTISEVSEDLDVPQHVLRFWESKFPQIKPLKRGGGRRYYRPEDVSLLRRTRVGPFSVEQGVGFEQLEQGPEALAAALLGVEAGLSEMQRVAIDRNGAATIRRGQRLILRGQMAPEEGPAYAVCFGSPVAVGEVENGEFVSTRVFNLA